MRPLRTWPMMGGEDVDGGEVGRETIGQLPMSRKLERPGARWKGKADGCGGREIGGADEASSAGFALDISRRDGRRYEVEG